MKRKDLLYDKIYSLPNLILADRKARKNKSKNYGVQVFDRHYMGNLTRLSNWLQSCKYHTSKYTTFTIYEPKERLIFRLPYFPDRIVHHAIMNIMEPIWINTFVKNTYSCIKGRGIHKAVNDIKYDLKKYPEETIYCLKLDIRHYYPSIDHEILKTIIRKKIKDDRLLMLLDEIIDSTTGVPIGNYLSQFFANLYLTYFDHWLKEDLRVKFYYRYCDDIVILGKSKEELREIFKKIQEYLTTNLKLEIKHNWQIFNIDIRGIDFLGYVFRHSHTRLRKTTKHRLCMKVVNQSRYYKTTKTRHNKIGSYFGWLKYCNSLRLKNKLNIYYNEKIF